VRLLVLFLGTIAAVLASLMLLTWWIDPFGQFYDGGLLRAAMGGTQPCLISEDLLGSGSWLPFKEDVYRTLRPRTIVVGTSRVLKMGSAPGERDFANLGMPGTGVELLEPLFRRLHEERPGPLTVYIGVELFWFNPSWKSFNPFEPSWKSPVAFGSRWLSDMRYLLARQNVTTSLSRAVHDPEFLWRRWQRERIGRWCALDRGSRLRAGKVYAWQANGSVVYSDELVGKPLPRILVPANPLAVQEGYYGNFHEFDQDRLRRLDAVLSLARSYGWHVVGFSPPSTTRYADRLASNPYVAARWREFGMLVPRLFKRHRIAFLDLRRAADVPCPEWAFYMDAWHAKPLCLETVRRLLEEAGAGMRSP
jgi:hypothetical protein